MAEVKLLVDEHRDALDIFTTWLPRIALAIVFVSVGAQKFDAHSMWVRVFDRIGFGDWFRYLTGVMQIGGAVLLLIPPVAAIGFLVVACTMAGAVAFWVFVAHQALAAIIPGALLLAIVVFGAGEVVRVARNLRRRSVSN